MDKNLNINIASNDGQVIVRPTIFVVALSLMEHGLSGGDVRLRAMLQRWCKKADIIVFTSIAGQKNMESWDITVSYVVSSSFSDKLRSKSDLFAQVGNYWALTTMSLKIIPEGKIPDVIYVQTDFPFEMKLGVRLKKKYPTARLVALSHHSYREIYGMTGSLHHLVLKKMQEYSYRLMAKYADYVTVLPTVTGDSCKEDLEKAGMSSNKIGRMWNGVDLDVINKIESNDKIYDACVIGLRRNKGLLDISEIWQKVCEKRAGSVLHIIGNIADIDKQWLENELGSVGLEKSVVFGGHFSPPQLYKEIKKSWICIAPTHQEPYGIAICEAMACGLPVVGYDLDNYQRLHTGILKTVACFNNDEFAEDIVELLDDADQLQKMVIYGKNHILEFNNDKIAESDLRIILHRGNSI